MRKKAIVIGASITGLLTSRVLSNHFEEVIVFEKDVLNDPNLRMGIPQMNHVHMLLARGGKILTKLFPEIEVELLKKGAHKIDFLDDAKFLLPTGWAPKFRSGVTSYTCSRILLEQTIRNQVLQKFPKIIILQGRTIKHLILNSEKTGVIGVKCQNNGKLESIEADLVVDASGKNTKTPVWLEELGFQKPSQVRIDSFVSYATRIYKKPSNQKTNWKMLAILNRPNHNPRTGVIYPIEDGKWLVGLSRIGKIHPPTDEAGFLEFIKNLPTNEMYESIMEASPVSEIFGYSIKGSRMYQYEKLSRWPQNFVVIGDSVCIFNPYYGQGMTSAALCVELLSKNLELLQNQTDWDGFAKKFQNDLAKIVSLPWVLGTSEDLRWPTTKGKKLGFSTSIMQKYVNNVMLLAPYSELATKSFIEMMHMTKPPTVLFHPKIMVQMILKSIQGKLRED